MRSFSLIVFQTILFAGASCVSAQTASQAPRGLDAANVVLTAPTANDKGAMSLGNGKVGVSAWVEPTGDLVFYISSPDSFSEVCQLLKIGKVRVHLSPSPFSKGTPFKEELNIRQGRLVVDMGDTHLEIFVEAKHPVICVAGRSVKPRTVTVSYEGWRNARRVLKGEALSSTRTMSGAPANREIAEAADVLVSAMQAPKGIAWYHRNETSIVPFTLKHQALGNAPGAYDPLLHRTFGAWMEGAGFEREGNKSLVTKGDVHQFDLRIACPVMIADTAEVWMKAAQNALLSSPNVDQARKETETAWQEFWDRSWVIAKIKPASRGKLNENKLTQGYNLTRYMFACEGRGEFPIKFNGGIFTLDPGKGLTPDWRRWGDCFWYQNTRHMYHPMLRAGDFDLMTPFFSFYQRSIPLAEARSQIYYGAKGAYFPETMTIFGTYGNSEYGWGPKKNPGDISNPYIRQIWSQGPELVSLMLDYWDWTQDQNFAKKTLVPTAHAVLEYFNTRFRKDANGHLVITPTQAIETYRTGVVINDMPCVAGLNAITSRLTALPPALVSPTDRAFFEQMKAACPPIPTETRKLKGVPVQTLAIAEKYNPRQGNIENPALYAVWPFYLYGVGKPNLQIALNTYATRKHHLDLGWGPDGNDAACLGMANEAARIIQARLANSHQGYSFPAFWGPNYDWMPDQNHGGNLLETTQIMLIQHVGKKILLFPAWPKSWDVNFKLHALDNTIVEASFANGKTTSIIVTPPSRAKDVIDCSTLDEAAIEHAVAKPQ